MSQTQAVWSLTVHAADNASACVMLVLLPGTQVQVTREQLVKGCDTGHTHELQATCLKADGFFVAIRRVGQRIQVVFAERSSANNRTDWCNRDEIVTKLGDIFSSGCDLVMCVLGADAQLQNPIPWDRQDPQIFVKTLE